MTTQWTWYQSGIDLVPCSGCTKLIVPRAEKEVDGKMYCDDCIEEGDGDVSTNGSTQ